MKPTTRVRNGRTVPDHATLGGGCTCQNCTNLRHYLKTEKKKAQRHARLDTETSMLVSKYQVSAYPSTAHGFFTHDGMSYTSKGFNGANTWD